MYRAFFQARHCLKGQRVGPEPSVPKAGETSTGALSFRGARPGFTSTIGAAVTVESSQTITMCTYSIILHIYKYTIDLYCRVVI
jgi:hypothetical protein